MWGIVYRKSKKDSLCFGWKMLPKQSGRATRKNGFRWFKIQTSVSFTRTNISSSSSSCSYWYLLCLQGKFNTKCIICTLKIKGNDITWYAPSSLEELAKLKSDFPDAKLITGNTECRLEQKFRKIEYARQIYTRGIKEICEINITDDFIEIGSGIEFSLFYFLWTIHPYFSYWRIYWETLGKLWPSMKSKNRWKSDSKTWVN